MFPRKPSRRRFLATSAAVAGGLIGSAAYSSVRFTSQKQLQTRAFASAAPQPFLGLPRHIEFASESLLTSTNLATRVLGRSPLTVPVLGLGGSASPWLVLGPKPKAIAIIERAYEGGIRYFDTAANYGPSEERLGQVLPAVRSEVMIATKTSHREYDLAWQQARKFPAKTQNPTTSTSGSSTPSPTTGMWIPC